MGTFVEYLTNLGFDAGKEFLVDSKKQAEAKEIIRNYIKLQANINEMCSLAEEIDFKGIAEYLSTDLLEDVKIYLFLKKPIAKIGNTIWKEHMNVPNLKLKFKKTG